MERVKQIPKTHRHSVEGCQGHFFCKSDGIPQVEEELGMMALMQPNEVNEVRRIIKRDTLHGGPNSIENLLK